MQTRLADFLGRPPQRWNGGDKEALTTAEWTATVDIIEDDEQYVIKAELSEIPKEGIKVTPPEWCARDLRGTQA
jgi:HSP20 family protein